MLLSIFVLRLCLYVLSKLIAVLRLNKVRIFRIGVLLLDFSSRAKAGFTLLLLHRLVDFVQHLQLLGLDEGRVPFHCVIDIVLNRINIVIFQ